MDLNLLVTRPAARLFCTPVDMPAIVGKVVIPGEAVEEAGLSSAVFVWGGRTHAAFAGRSGQAGPSSPIVEVGDIVTCRVARINPRLTNLEILCVGKGCVPLREPCAGLLRREEVRQSENDEPIQMHQCFRLGDIVLARVVSPGDARAYYVSTAADELGVVIARHSESQATMVPVSWREMECPVTKIRERRKVARPSPEAGVATGTADGGAPHSSHERVPE